MSYFSTLLGFGQSYGLGRGVHGACHSIWLSLESLLPRDVEAGLIEPTDVVVAFDYGSHVGFRIQHENGEVISAEKVCSTYADLVQLLQSTYADTYVANPAAPVQENAEDASDSTLIDDTLERIRDAAIAQANGEDSDEDFQDDDGVEVDIDDDLTATPTKQEAVIVTLEKPKGKPTSGKYKAAIEQMVSTLTDYYADELDEIELDDDGLTELLGDVFSDQRSFDVDTALSFCDNFVDYLEFEEE